MCPPIPSRIAGGSSAAICTCCLIALQALPGGSSSGRLNSMNSPSKAGRKLLNMLHLRKATEQALMKAIGNVPARLMHIPIQVGGGGNRQKFKR